MDLQAWLFALQALVVVALMALVAAAVYFVAIDPLISGMAKIAWIIGILLVPAVGALAWFAWGWLGRPGSSPSGSTVRLTHRS